MANYIVGITGASGSIYGIHLLHELCRLKHNVDLVITNAGKMVLKEEAGISSDRELKNKLSLCNKFLRIWDNSNFEAPFMSGSNPFDALIIIPCSMGKLASISNGISTNLLERTADVALKERRKLILVVRETPLSLIHLENMVKVTKAGGIILPAMPAFYHHPQKIEDIIDFVVAKILNLLGIKHDLLKGWRNNRNY